MTVFDIVAAIWVYLLTAAVLAIALSGEYGLRIPGRLSALRILVISLAWPLYLVALPLILFYIFFKD